MLKVNDKVRVTKRADSNSPNWIEVGQGRIRKVYYDRLGIQTHAEYTDKDWTNQDVTETLPVDSNCLKLIKYGKESN